MASQADYKDRQFLAVIGDEVRDQRIASVGNDGEAHTHAHPGLGHRPPSCRYRREYLPQPARITKVD